MKQCTHSEWSEQRAGNCLFCRESRILSRMVHHFICAMRLSVRTESVRCVHGMRRILIVLLVLVAFFPAARAQDSSSVIPAMKKDGWNLLGAMGNVLSSPLRWDGNDVLLAGGITAGTGAAFLLDDETYALMARNHSRSNDDLRKVAVEFGSGYVAVGVPVVLYATGLAIKDTWLRETAVTVGGTVILTSALTTISKSIIGRARPYSELGNHHFRPFTLSDDYKSFPSGHTTAAFALAASLAGRIDNVWASIGLYGAATAASVSRIYSRDHWLSDVVFAAAYSTVVARSMVRWFDRDRAPDDGALRFLPTGNGVMLVVIF
jgi:membrane-associated phospholipid phosphatase